MADVAGTAPAADAVDQQPRASKPSQRTALTVLGVVAAMLIGVVIGFLLRMPLEKDSAADTPGPVDIGFAQDMTTHHNQAIEMAGVALSNSTDGPVRNLAYDILTTQQNQAGQMQGWLALWGKPGSSSDGYMGWMSEGSDSGHDHGGHAMAHNGPVATMPGMASAQELAALRQARGAALDTMFLQLMLRHHQGGLSMMEYGAANADVSTVRELAQTMVDTQQNESKTMTDMLAQRGAQPLPMN